MSKKSQVALTDLFIALFVATSLIIIIIFTWNRYIMTLNDESEHKEMQIIAFQVADLLVKSSGDPKNWENNPSNINVIGLSSSDRNLSIEKVNEFINLSYNNTAGKLGLEFYDFSFQLKHINGTQMINYGKNSSNNVVNVQRIVSYKDEKTIMEFAVWK